jgi:hypothetical protein
LGGVWGGPQTKIPTSWPGFFMLIRFVRLVRIQQQVSRLHFIIKETKIKETVSFVVCHYASNIK